MPTKVSEKYTKEKNINEDRIIEKGDMTKEYLSWEQMDRKQYKQKYSKINLIKDNQLQGWIKKYWS